MKSGYGQVVDVRKYRTYGTTRVIVEFPIESYKELVEVFDETPVLLIRATLGEQPFGLVDIDAPKHIPEELTAEQTPLDPPRGMANLRIYAVVLCKTVAFQHYVLEQIGGCVEDYQEDDGEHLAKKYILSACNIKSRSELEIDQEAREKFHRLVRIPYAQHCAQNGIDNEAMR